MYFQIMIYLFYLMSGTRSKIFSFLFLFVIHLALPKYIFINIQYCYLSKALIISGVIWWFARYFPTLWSNRPKTPSIFMNSLTGLTESHTSFHNFELITLVNPSFCSLTRPLYLQHSAPFKAILSWTA